MITEVTTFKERLMMLDPFSDDFVLNADDLIEELSWEVTESAYPFVFAFFETHPTADCGAPGALVHMVEHFYPNYVEALKESVRRKPNYNGVLMINRILNSELESTERAEYMDILKTTTFADSAPEVVRKLARGFLERREKIDD